MKKIIFLPLVFLFNIVFAQNTDDILGNWLNQDNDAKIEIYKEGNSFFGKLIWLKEPNEKDGSPKIDDKNPDENLRNRNLQGLVIVKNLKFDKKDKEWSGGKIYDPKSGKTYKCFAKIDGENLNLRGYIGFSFIGRTATWSRVE